MQSSVMAFSFGINAILADTYPNNAKADLISSAESQKMTVSSFPEQGQSVHYFKVGQESDLLSLFHNNRIWYMTTLGFKSCEMK